VAACCRKIGRPSPRRYTPPRASGVLYSYLRARDLHASRLSFSLPDSLADSFAFDPDGMPPNGNMNPPRPSGLFTHNTYGYEGQYDGTNSSTEGAREAVMGSNSRHHSQGVVASHFLAQDRESWMDFLREDGTEGSVNQEPQTSLPGQGSSLPGQGSLASSFAPAATSEARTNPSSSRYTLPNRPSPRTDSSSSRSSGDRKRRLTTADSPVRRPSSIRMHSENAGNTSADPIVLDSSPASMRALPPTPPVVSQANTASVRRQSDIVLPQWQPDSEVSQCPVCKKPFTFLYRKHHCRYASTRHHCYPVLSKHMAYLPSDLPRPQDSAMRWWRSGHLEEMMADFETENAEESCALNARHIALPSHDNSSSIRHMKLQ
jgi:hypothetical protein